MADERDEGGFEVGGFGVMAMDELIAFAAQRSLANETANFMSRLEPERMKGLLEIATTLLKETTDRYMQMAAEQKLIDYTPEDGFGSLRAMLMGVSVIALASIINGDTLNAMLIQAREKARQEAGVAPDAKAPSPEQAAKIALSVLMQAAFSKPDADPIDKSRLN